MALEPLDYDRWRDAIYGAGHRPRLFLLSGDPPDISLIEDGKGGRNGGFGSMCEACGAHWPITRPKPHHKVDYSTIKPCPGEPEEKEQ